MSNFWNKLIGYDKKEKVIDSLNSIYAMFDLSPASWFKRNYDAFAVDGYQKNVIAHRCIDEISCSIGSLVWILYDKNGNEIESHELLELLKRPNPMQGQSAFFQEMEMFKQITGNSYIHTVMNTRNVPQELYVLEAPKVIIKPIKTKNPTLYEYRPNKNDNDIIQ